MPSIQTLSWPPQNHPGRLFASRILTLPPHRSGKNQSPYWCLVRVVVTFCLNTGVLLDCALGPAKLSEQALTAQLLAVSWLKTLLVADRNFGVYSVVRAAQAASAQILVRLTQSRANKLARQAKVRWVGRPQSNSKPWEGLLDQVGRCRRPKRRKPRPPEPRAIRYFKQDFPRLVGDRAIARKHLKNANAKS